jgi:hypothetical protein
MGAWSHEPFGNDDAGDWIYELEDSTDFSVIERTLAAVVTQAADYLEAPECTSALAAAEIVAALIGHPVATLPESAAAWVRGKAKPDDALIAQAKSAVTAILGASELQELWEESDHYAKWQEVTKDLLARLG